MLYREAVPEDIPGIVALLEEIMRDHSVEPPPAERLLTVVQSAFASSSHTFIVAETPHGLAGMCALIFSLSTWSAGLVCEVQDLVVTASHRRAQVGRGLLRAAESNARGRGCMRLFLLAESWNLEAHRFYRRMGLAEKTCLDFERDLRAKAEPGD
jgi:N-acetylglutamate synthase-like GNAT family acetyltransferase